MDDFRCFLTLDPRYEICMIIFFNDFFVWILSTLNASYFVNNLFNDTMCFHTLDPNHVSHWSAFVFAYYSGVSCWDIGFGKDFSPSNCICLFYICVFVYQCILYLCLSTCLVIQVWASGETLGGLRGDFHCTALCTAHCALPPPPLEFSPPWARGQDPSLSSTTGSGKRAFLSRLSNFSSPRRLKPLSCTSHLSHGIRKDFQTQEGPKNCMANKRVRKILSDFCWAPK